MVVPVRKEQATTDHVLLRGGWDSKEESHVGMKENFMSEDKKGIGESTEETGKTTTK